MKKNILLTIILLIFTFSGFAQKVPLINKLKQVSQIPVEVPQRVQAIALEGNNLWFSIYLDKGRYVKYNRQTDTWDFEQDTNLRGSIPKVTGRFASPGAMVFIEGKLWLGSSYGESFGWIDINDGKQFKVFEKLYKPGLKGSQSYSDMTFDGTYIWAAWHSFNWRTDESKTQLLLKIDKDTGEVIAEYPLPPGNASDGTHGLAFDGTTLWHAKGKKLSAIDLNGKLTTQYALPELNRPSGLVWDGSSLWIVEFNGKLWNLPFETF
jgi:hypothetical protein